MEHPYYLYKTVYYSEQENLNHMFNLIKRRMAICTCSELVDTHDHTTNRKSGFIQNYLLSRRHKSFMFLLCLN